MKNTIKKIAAAAMAFTLLGTGTTIANRTSKPAVLVANAANCQYHRADNTYVDKSTYYTCNYGCKHYAVRCRCCNAIRWYQ